MFDELVRCRQWLEPALQYADGTHDWDDIVAALYSRQMQLWPLERSALVTEIQQFPRKRVLNVFLGGGDLDELRAFVPTVAEFARANGCTALQCSGRRGWLRAIDGGTEKTPIYRRSIMEKGL
jgi:hypothetical protein